jgi:hypothetical protein
MAVYSVPFLRGMDRKSFLLKKLRRSRHLQFPSIFSGLFPNYLQGDEANGALYFLHPIDRLALQPS